MADNNYSEDENVASISNDAQNNGRLNETSSFQYDDDDESAAESADEYTDDTNNVITAKQNIPNNINDGAKHIIPANVSSLQIKYVQKSVNIIYSWKLRMNDYANGKFNARVIPSDIAINKIQNILPGKKARNHFIPLEVQVVSSYNDSPYPFIVSCGKWLKKYNQSLPQYVTTGGVTGHFEILPDKTVYDITGGCPIFSRTDDDIKSINNRLKNSLTCLIGIADKDITTGVSLRAGNYDYFIENTCLMWSILRSDNKCRTYLQEAKDGVIIDKSGYEEFQQHVLTSATELNKIAMDIKNMSAKLVFIDTGKKSDRTQFVDNTIAAVGNISNTEKEILLNTTYTIQTTLLVSGLFFYDEK